MYALLATLVVLFHFALILFVILGGLLAFRWKRAPWLHLPALAWGGFVEVTGRICPLTPLENHLRRAAGAGDYAGGFIEQYLIPIMYPPGLTSQVQFALAGALVAANVTIYALVLRRWRRAARAGAVNQS